MGKTIGFIGNFQVPFTTENDLAWSLQQLGHTVYQFQEQEFRTEYIMEAVETRNIELVLYVHTHGWETPGDYDLTELFGRLKDKGIPTASFHLDYWYGLQREGDVGNHPFWHTEFVFTADGGSEQWFKDKGINHFWLPPGVVKREAVFVAPRDEFQHDVIFVGSRNYHPEWPYRPQLIDFLEQQYGERFALYGGQGIRTIRGMELNSLYRSARVVVGDSLCLNFTHENYWSDRATETMGRGGFLIHPRIKGMEQLFEDKKHLAYYDFNDFDGLRKTIDYYITNYAEREQIRLTGHLHTRDNHTYTNRMQQMLDTIFTEAKK